MTTGRNATGSPGLGPLDLDTRGDGALLTTPVVTTAQPTELEDPWAQLSEQLAWEERRVVSPPPALPPTATADLLPEELPSAESAAAASFTSVPPGEPAPAPALFSAPSLLGELAAAPAAGFASALLGEPARASGFAALYPGELTKAAAGAALEPTAASAQAAPRQEGAIASMLAASPVVTRSPTDPVQSRKEPTAGELPTGPALQDRSSSEPRARWRAKAQERGLRSAFVTAADDFAPAQRQPAAAALPHSNTTPALSPRPSALTDAAPRISSTAPALSPQPSAWLDAPASQARAAATSEPAAPTAAASAGPAAPSDEKELGWSIGGSSLGENQPAGGRLFRALQRPRVPAATQPAAPVQPLQPSQPAAAPSPRTAGALIAEAAQAVKQSVQRGRRLLRQLLPARGAEGAAGSVAAPAPGDKRG